MAQAARRPRPHRADARLRRSVRLLRATIRRSDPALRVPRFAQEKGMGHRRPRPRRAAGPARHSRQQNLLKQNSSLTVNALAKMNYHAFGIGKNEIGLGLGEAMAQIFDNRRPLPRPLNNSLAQIGPQGLFRTAQRHAAHEIINVENATSKIGVIQHDGARPAQGTRRLSSKFVDSNMDALKKALKAFGDAGVEIGVVLHHEYPKIDPDKLPKNKLVAQGDRRGTQEEGAGMCPSSCAADEPQEEPEDPGDPTDDGALRRGGGAGLPGRAAEPADAHRRDGPQGKIRRPGRHLSAGQRGISWNIRTSR